MIDEKKKMTAPDSSVGADDGQSISQNSKTTIPDPDGKNNPPEDDLEEFFWQLSWSMESDDLHTVTLDDLMDHVFEGRSAVIENLLYTGTYILAGAPKIGKSFLVAQIAHHVSTGQMLWGYKVRQGTVLYAQAFYGVLSAVFDEAEEADVSPEFAAEIAEGITKIVANHSQVDWTNNKTIHDRISQDIDDLFYDYEKKRGLKLSFDTIDKIIENVKTVALRRF